ncbi:hypothetical protein O181_029383 [Austropuccinia psidii MF-1]|uniref:Uncharacterized protein n=1 Tax=Austropuccinia psidii MF-1 TaxID=1389203 RepID=A0A9Q3H2P8_9BASI|nr:hypothetical protein [Austropuccinia psidii MF-1]
MLIIQYLIIHSILGSHTGSEQHSKHHTLEENYIPIETQSQANTPVTPSESDDSKGKGKRHSERIITAKKWTPISPQRNRKPQNYASIQGKPTLTTCTGKIKIINPVVTSKDKFPKAVDSKFVKGKVEEDREVLSRNRIPGGGHLGSSGGWKGIEGAHTYSAIHIPIQKKPQTRGLEGYGPSSSAPPAPQRPFSMEHGPQEVQPRIPLGTTWGRLPEDMSGGNRLQKPHGNHQSLESHQAVQTPGGEGKQDKGQSSHYPSHRRTTDPDREYSDSFRLTRRSCQENTRTQGKKQDLFQTKAERVRPNDPEAVGLGERSTLEPEIVVHISTISSAINKNITPTQI